MRTLAFLFGVLVFAGLVVMAVAGFPGARGFLATGVGIVLIIALGVQMGGRHSSSRGSRFAGDPTGEPGDPTGEPGGPVTAEAANPPPAAPGDEPAPGGAQAGSAPATGPESESEPEPGGR